MARIRFIEGSKAEWHVGERLLEGTDEQLSALEANTELCTHSEGDEKTLQLIEAKYAPNMIVPNHAHEIDEIIYIVSGEMRMGARVLGPGSSIFVAENTLYGFTAGPDGLRILNFRPHKDLSYRPAPEFLARDPNAIGKQSASVSAG